MSAPNVFLLTIDSLRADVIFSERPRTPHIDAFAQAGAAFTQCIATTTTTTSSFSSILTGCYPPRHGVRGLQNHELSTAVTTWPEAFGVAGYRTHAEVTGPLLPETGVLRGFDETRHRPDYEQPFFGWRDYVLERMRDMGSPWFFLLHIGEVHRPYRIPPDFSERFDKQGYEGAVTAADEYLAPLFDALPGNTIVVITGDHGDQYATGALEIKKVRAATNLRRKLRLSKWFGWADKRLAGLAVGPAFGLDEQLIRVPLIVSGPGIAASEISDQVRHVDLFPTIADLCGVEVGSEMDGRSLRPLIEGRSLPEEPAYAEAVGVKEESRVTAARTPDWKLLKQKGQSPILHSLDGAAGPDERRNLYRRNPEVARQLESYIDTVDLGYL